MSVRALDVPLPLSPLAARALDAEDADGWYPSRPTGRGWQERATAVRADVGEGWLERLRPALAPAGDALQRLERAAAGGVVITTGQQPGLFGGPLYTWFKALTALALADRLQEELSLPVAPVFWAATDDSDLAEATGTIVALPGGFEPIRVTIDPTPHWDTPMAMVAVGDPSEALARLAAACGSAANAQIVRSVRAAYRPENTLGGAYIELLREALHPLGIAVLDASHPATRSAAAPVLRRALAEADVVAERLHARSVEIAAAGFRPQVHDIAGRTLVFRLNGDRRHRIRVADAAAVARDAGEDELLPNVLMRPIVERSLLPSVAYVGGPAEIAYFAQVSAVAEALQIRSPLIVPRWSGFVLEPHVSAALEKLGMSIEELRDPHAAEGRIARAELPESIRELLERLRAQAAELGPAVLTEARQANLPLGAGVVEGAARQIAHKIDRFERRLLAAVKRRGSDRLQLLATARGSLFPGDIPQERALNAIPLLARHGSTPLEVVLQAARTHVSSL